MNSLEGRLKISAMRRSWIVISVLTVALFSLGITVMITAVLLKIALIGTWIAIPCFLFALVGTSLFFPFWKINEIEVSRYLNQYYPELEESSGLLLKQSDELNVLERLQYGKVNQTIQGLSLPGQPFKRLWISAVVFVITVAIGLSVTYLLPLQVSATKLRPSVALGQPVAKEYIPAEVSDFNIEITPPAYTGVASRNQRQFYIKAERGSRVSWLIQTTLAVKRLRLIFNDRENIVMKPVNGENKDWTFEKVIYEPGFYQVEIDGKRSDLYQIEIIPDQPVIIRILNPKQHSTIDYGQPQTVNLKLSLKDDYGIKNAFIAATMASGKGEGVSFTEKKLLFNIHFNNHRNLFLNKSIDLKSLGMKPGDELYFYVSALDNHGQTSRSDMYFVSIVDTTELMSMTGMSGGVNLVPEYFRSQRQIIIDTEKLLKEKTTMDDKLFKEKSNDIGVDQKLLRLRYGKFLGEESETEIGGDGEHHEGDGHDHHADDGHDRGETGKQQDKVQEIMDQYAHKHDIAEDATFFEPELKAQLKAVLTEMWNSELRLRTYKAQDALPYEYKALRLLKDLQQKSRAYVAKTTYKTAQLKPEKRLSGELDKIVSPLQQGEFKGNDVQVIALKSTLSFIESIKAGAFISEGDIFILKEAERLMVNAASGNPTVFLRALKDLRKVTTSKLASTADLTSIQRAIKRLIPRETGKPDAKSMLPSKNLYERYFNNLKNLGQ
ncbi:MAG: hypothetical protein EOO92_00425 [Pedobacter sp.]|nr:MAG: hypothetical protein EOO92_00425 [Pedobacter sp.]